MRRGLLVLLLVSLCAWALPATAQETTATLVGTVSDQSGGVVPGVTIVAKNLATGRSYEAVSTATGVYTLQLLPVGEYEVSFQLTGFQTVTVKGISLHVNDRVEVNGKLSVGGLAEVVEVTAAQQFVQPTPALQSLVDEKQVQELPLNNRNFVQLATLAPGVSSDLPDEVGIGLTSTVSISVNGSRRNAVNWLVDGVSNVDVGSNITLLSTPTLESIQEFKIITNGYAAEWPRSGGGVVNVVTKSGTSKFSGNGYYFGRSDKLNANSWLRNKSTDPTVAGHPPALDYKNYGYTAGGPVLPGKVFFFWSQEWRDITRAPSSLTATVPDPTWLTDPTSTNYVAPALRDPNAMKLLAAYPAPNVAGKNQYLVSSPNVQKTRQEVIRLDYDLTPRWRISGRYTHDLSQTEELGGLFNGIAVPNIATTHTDTPGQVFSFQVKTIASNSALNEFSYQKSGNKIDTSNPSGTMGTRSDFGISIPEIYAENLTNRIPSIAIGGLSSFNSMQLYHIEYVNHTFTDNFSLQRGNHAFKAGVLLTFEQKNENAANVTQGSFSFAASTNPTRTAFQNFLLGNADGLCGANCSYSEFERDVTAHLRFNRYEMYVQDTWKARPNLTVDLGVRYSLYPPVTDANNMLGTFSPAAYKGTSPLFANAAGTSLTVGSGDLMDGMIVAGKNSPYGDAIYEYKKNAIQPRVGFSWDPASKGNTILRGAYGIYYDQPLVGIFEQNAFTSYPFVNSSSIQNARLSNPAAGTTASTMGLRGTYQATATDFANPRTMQWNLTMTQRVFKTGVIEIGYVGARGDNLIRPTNANFAQPSAVVALQQTVASAVNPVRPYRSYTDITMRETTASSRYHGLLTSFRWQPAKTTTLTVNYTLSRNQTDATNDRDSVDIPQNPANLAAEWADARTDRRHILSASYIYELPFFRDSKNAAARLALGGWQVSGITMVNSGPPVNRISVSTNGSRRGGFADYTPNVPVLAGQMDEWGTPNYWFNPYAFTPPADGTFGNSGRAPFRQPGFSRTDLTLSKNFYVKGSVRLQFRADLINAFNQVNWASDPSTNSLDNTCTTSTTTCVVSTDTFGQLISVRQAREVQLGLKLYW
jgi:hypothetical protein